jgi:hypothetical protein
MPAFTLRVSHNANGFSDKYLDPPFSGAVHSFGPIDNGTIKSEPNFGDVALEAEVLRGSDAIQVNAFLKAARLDFRCILR